LEKYLFKQQYDAVPSRTFGFPKRRIHVSVTNQNHRIGVVIAFKAKPGQRDALANHLSSAAQSYRDEVGTELFIVSLSPVDPDSVIVFEVYASEAAKAAHEAAPGYATIRAGTGVFLAGAPKITPLITIGGKGLL
jgi:quinol monooxygenase YgiN